MPSSTALHPEPPVDPEQPLRAELFSIAQLAAHATQLAGWHEVASGRHVSDGLLARLEDNHAALSEAYGLLAAAVERGRQLTPAGEWFVDNFHVIEEQVRIARRHLPRGYHAELPRLLNRGGVPRVYDLALELISHSHGRVDLDALRAFLGAYQSVHPLRLGELWAVPIMLRLALLENLRRVVVSVTAGRRDRERAAVWAERMLTVAAAEPGKVVLVVAEMVKDDPPLSAPFVAELATRLQGQGSAAVFPTAWLEQRLADRGDTIDQIFHQVSASQADDQVAVSNSIGTLRWIGATDWRDVVERLSVVERELGGDPAGVYPTMSFATRDRYRHVVEEIARRSASDEEAVARRAVDLSRAAQRARRGGAGERAAHVGYFLIDEGRAELERSVAMWRSPWLLLRRAATRARLPLFFAALAVVTVGTSALLAGPLDGRPAWQRALGWALLVVATSHAAVALVNWGITVLIRPRSLPRLDFSRGIPREHRTAVAVPAMLTSAEEIDELVEDLEVRYLANRDRNLVFALLTDHVDADAEVLEHDRALLARARAGIEALDARHRDDGGRFFLFHRDRQLNPREGVWMGRERKRGKLEDFNAALRGDRSAFSTVVGPLDALAGVRYVITLDADTGLPRDAAAELVGTLAHPLNRPYYDDARGRVTHGYAILQPRVGTTMASAAASRFARIFAGDPGIDPYTQTVSDVYQDAFAEGSFIGKGIYDVDAVTQALGERLPDDRILSHDLLEGAYCRAGLVSDVVLFEDFPPRHAVDVSRRHRWMRGDWQIARWLCGPVPGKRGRTRNPLHALSRWKIFDNLRRSLVPIALVAILLLGWSAPGLAPAATLTCVGIVLVPGLIAALAQLCRPPSEMPYARHVGEVGRGLLRHLLRELFQLATLPYDAYVAGDAIARTAARLARRRRLLEWRTASDARRNGRHGLAASLRSMWIGPAAALAGVALTTRDPGALLVAAPLLCGWTIAPLLSWWLSQPVREAAAPLPDADRRFLRRLARRTWRFFEVHVGAEDNFLPPDNVQEEPYRGAAHRTSPTNIGMSLISNLAAHDLGYLDVGDLIDRTERTFATLDRLERFRGHFYNWYDTVTLEPLRPTYVSTVDSGNLAGHLLTLAAGLEELGERPIARSAVFAGLRDDLDLLAEASAGLPADVSRGELHRGLRELPDGARAIHRRLGELAVAAGAAEEGAGEGEPGWWARAFADRCRRARADLEHLMPWLAHGGAAPAALDALDLVGLAAIDLDALALAPELTQAVGLGRERAAARLAALDRLARRARALADLDYEFLYDRERHLLAIGYNVVDHRLDASYYDLLASEARLTSYVAIAQGKLPQAHWFHLGRALTASGGKPALLSWSGSMFEYLMPLLVMPSYPGTVLDQTYRAVVRRQIAYGDERGVPWGVSESGYFKTDAQLNYQYRAFGVPGLGFKRGLAEDLVIAPYACAMALMVEPGPATANLRRLVADGRSGVCGMYEAIDYTAARMPPDKDGVTIQSYMAHHQGMTLLALDHVLCDRPMQRRFLADPALRAVALLLEERVSTAPTIDPHPAETGAAPKEASESDSGIRVIATPATPAPDVQLLSNGRLHTVVTNAGGGYLRWRDLAVTRWREDATCDAWGSFVYLRDVERGEHWSAAHQPTLARADRYEVIYSQGRAEFRRADGPIETHVEISISPEDDVELRRVCLTNTGDRPVTLELTSYSEIVLAAPAADLAHPAFSSLFVQTELDRARRAILATRRPRSGGERPPWLVHLIAGDRLDDGALSYETSRERFIGRGRTVADPIAMHRPLSDTVGSVLDPVAAIRCRLTLGPDQQARVNLVTGVAETREAAVALAEKYGDRHLADRVLELSWTHSGVVQRRIDASNAEALLYARLASSVIYANPVLRAPRNVIDRNRSGQSGLWAYGISGDLPIVLCRISDGARIELVRQLVKAHAYFRLKGLACDLVIWNEDPSGYRQDLQDQIMAVISSLAEGNMLDRPGGIFVRRAEQMSGEDAVLMQTVARVVLVDTAGSLAEQLDRRAPAEVPPHKFPGRDRRERRVGQPPAPPPPIERVDLAMWNGLGGFTQDGKEYVITTAPGARTPTPWVNVIANPHFGTVVSESGGAYTWCENAHSYRLTPWHNDPVGDESGEALYLRDEEDGAFWSPTPLPAGDGAPYATRHGFGYTVFEHAGASGIASELRTYVASDAPVKFVALKLRNLSGRPRRLSATAVFELVLGSSRAANAPHVVTELDPKSGGLFARNAYNGEFGERVAFLDASEERRTISGDRREVIGRNGDRGRPACMRRVRLSGRVGPALDPCMAMQVVVDLAAGQEREIVFTFGSGRDLADARTLVARFRGKASARQALEGVWAHWERALGAAQVKTPHRSLDILANGWLLYQVLSSRMWGRTGFYQSGGAFGFRDQLQDAMALLHAAPALLREQIVRCAGRQFREGDVQHWWHPTLGRGVRTRISDDYLWLPHAVCRYVAALGDIGVLEERVPFLEGRAVKPDEEGYYDLPAQSDEQATVFEHCVRAIKNGLRFGAHGLPLMGSGDWNDGMNLVGHEGRGESVWLAFFLHDVLTRFADIARLRPDGPTVELCEREAARLGAAIERGGWDGEWYRRAYMDDGTPLGSRHSPECQIDSLPQSWAVLSRVGDPERARRGMAAVDARLVDRDLGIIKLFDPPFDRSELEPGYIKGYVPGVRENGGQYTHAAIWTAMAFAALGERERAWELFDLIDPLRHGGDADAIATYKVEPYVIAADVYGNPQHAGRGGWTWYTGSAGWMYRLISESLLGLYLDVDRLRIAPLMPAGWTGYELSYRYRETRYQIRIVRRGPGDQVTRALCDGVEQEDRTIPLIDDRKEHVAVVEIGGVPR